MRVDALVEGVAAIREQRESERHAAELARLSDAELHELYREADPAPDFALPAGLAGLSTARLTLAYRNAE